MGKEVRTVFRALAKPFILPIAFLSIGEGKQGKLLVLILTSYSRHVETTWHSLGTCSMAPKNGNSVVKHGVLDERLNVHGVKGLKVADLSICPDNVGCNTYSTALLIGEKCAVLTGEDLGYSGSALDMKVPDYQAPSEVKGLARL